MSKMIFLDKTFYNAAVVAGCNPSAIRELKELEDVFNYEDMCLIKAQSEKLSAMDLRFGFSPYSNDKSYATPSAVDVNVEKLNSPFLDEPINFNKKLESLSVIVTLNGDIILTDYTEEEAPLRERIICGLAERFSLAYAMRSKFWKL